MKRFLFCSALLLCAGAATSANSQVAMSPYVNNSQVAVPPQDPQSVVIDSPIFVNNAGATFSVDMTGIQIPLNNTFFTPGPDTLFTTSSTLNYTNYGRLTGIPGFDFENFPASSGIVKPADSFVNDDVGNFGGGEIDITNIYGGANIFENGSRLFNTSLVIAPINFDALGLATLKVRANNVLNSGLITMDNSGLMDIVGNDLNLNRGRFLMTGAASGAQILASAFAFVGNTNLSPWFPSAQLGPNSASSPIFPIGGGFDVMTLTNATVYFQDLNPTPQNSNVVWRVIFLQDHSPSNVTAKVYFGGDPNLGAGAFHIEWAGTYRDPLTGNAANNFFYLNDEPGNQYNTNNYFSPLNEFSINESPVKLTILAPAAPGFTPTPFTDTVTNNFAFLSLAPTALLVDTNSVVGGNPTNLPGRIQLEASNSMDLANSRISGETYLRITSPVNFLGNGNSQISAPYADLNLGVPTGSLTVSNLLTPVLPAWTGVPNAPSATFFTPMGGIQAYSASYKFVDATGVTNDVRILMVNSAIQPSAAAFQKDVTFNSGNVLNVADALHIYNTFSSDARTLTLSTNDNSAYSLAGEINFLSPTLFWSASLPNLLNLTNWGAITSPNFQVFADNMPTPTSDLNLAMPYLTFVNHGLIENNGVAIRANYFLNSGIITNETHGAIDIKATTAIGTNSLFMATNGPVSIVADTILLSNTVINAGQYLSFSPSCFLSDGYAFGNEFGHATNASLPNVVTNGNNWTVNGGVRVLTQPSSGDLLGTTITNVALNSLNSLNVWSGQDRGASPSGFAENVALGRMVLAADANPSHFTFAPATGKNALYVDSLEFLGSVTNTDANGNYTSISILPGMKIYYAQALLNGASIAEKLNGKNGGGFIWVSNYAGVYSSTNLNGTLYNEALVISPDIDSNGNGSVNRDDPTPIPAGLTFDVSNAGPIACGGGSNPPGQDPSSDPANNGVAHTPGILKFPAEQQQDGSGGGSVSFLLAQGSYNGLFYETNGVNPAHAGSFTAELNRRGTFTAKLQLGGKTYSLTKKFDPTGDFGPYTFSNKKLPAITLALQLVNNDEITGQVAGDGWAAQLLAFSSVNNAASFGTGKHSLVLSANTNGSTAASGDSYGTMTLNRNGNIQWTGALPDGSKASQKSALSKDGLWPLYSSLYGGNGALIGWLQLTNASSDIGGSAIWLAPANPNSPFPNGVTNELDAVGSDLTSALTGLQMTVILSGPQLPANVTNSVTISGKNGTGDNSLTLSVDVKNGLFNGSVIDPGSSQKLSFQGALLEKSGMGGGFFLNADKNQGGKVSLAPAN